MVDITTVPGKYGPNDRIVLADGKAWTCSEMAKHNSEIWHNENRKYPNGLGQWHNMAYQLVCHKHGKFPSPAEISPEMEKEIDITAKKLKNDFTI